MPSQKWGLYASLCRFSSQDNPLRWGFPTYNRVSVGYSCCDRAPGYLPLHGCGSDARRRMRASAKCELATAMEAYLSRDDSFFWTGSCGRSSLQIVMVNTDFSRVDVSKCHIESNPIETLLCFPVTLFFALKPWEVRFETLIEEKGLWPGMLVGA